MLQCYQCAGGYDSRVAENVEHYNELRGLADKLGVTDHVTFVRSFTDAQKLVLLDRCAGARSTGLVLRSRVLSGWIVGCIWAS
jgi:hypothetical protein